MRTLFLYRHSLTSANARRLYCGKCDLPLSGPGRELAERVRASAPPPRCDLTVSSGLKRATETLFLLTGEEASITIPDLQEMDFGRFDMHGYEELKADADYLAWISDTSGEYRCPGGESVKRFRERVLSGAAALLELPWESALVVCHGGSIVHMMQAWFPKEPHGFYDWQPAACGGWRIVFEGEQPLSFGALQG